MEIRCPTCSHFIVEVEELTGILKARFHCRSCNTDTRIDSEPGRPAVIIGGIKPRAKVKVPVNKR